jgi:uncharacterized protein (TIGR02646 family)
MHKVLRNDAPEGLIEKDKEWKEQFNLNPSLKPDWEGFSKTTLRKNTIKRLDEMYSGCCCYCEGKIKNTSYPEIEHFKPKADFPELCFDYSNFHFTCKRCNLAKGRQYNEDMVSPSDENPEEFICFKGELAIGIDNSESGTRMIKILKLNDRSDLKEERSKYLNTFARNYSLIIKTIESVLANGNNEGLEIVKPFINEFISEVKMKSVHGESYCTMIKHNFTDKIRRLQEVL